MHVRACTHLMCRCGCKYVCIRAFVHMHARMHASPYGSQVCKSHRFDPQMLGGPYPSPKMVSLRSSLCSFSVRNRTGGKPIEIAEVCIFRQGTRNGRSICVCAQASLVHVHLCAHLCVYFGVCMDVCMLICACACAHVCKKGCSISSVSPLSIITGHTPEVLMSTLSTQQQHAQLKAHSQQLRIGSRTAKQEAEQHPQ